MSDPQTSNILLNVPTRGSDVDQWDVPLNGNSSAIDGYFGGTQIISVANAPITLTSPSGSPTPSGGPTQAQNAVLSFTGAMTANVQVTLPLPGSYIVENLTTGNFVLTFAAANSGQVIAIDQGESVRIYNNGTNVRFCDLGRVGSREFWDGITSMPAWVTACTVPPYLLCDGSIYSFSTYPYLGNRLKGAFGGNGITTFGVPDLRGRMAIPYDGTGARITAAGCGINGMTIGAAGGSQSETLITANLPPYTPLGSVSASASTNAQLPTAFAGVNVGGTFSPGYNFVGGSVSVSASFSGTPQGGTSTPFGIVQPSQVTGIAVIRAA